MSSRRGRTLVAVALLALSGAGSERAAAACARERVEVVVLGSGGPELHEGRAATSHLVLVDGRARVLVDLGGGAFGHFQRLDARVEDLAAVLFTHLHVDHVADLPTLLKSAWFGPRRAPLPLAGPRGNALVPGLVAFVEGLFAGAGRAPFGYLGGLLDGSEAFRIEPSEWPADDARPGPLTEPALQTRAAVVDHGPIPALAWRIDVEGCSVVVSGDTAAGDEALPRLAAGAHLLIAHHAIPEEATGVARRLHMPPSRIGEVAAAAGVGRLVLAHRMRRTLGQEEASLAAIRRHYAGPVDFAEDLGRWRP